MRARRGRHRAPVRMPPPTPRATTDPPSHVGPVTVAPPCYDWETGDDPDVC